ncbi:transglycosylase family protein [Rhodococcus spongiicola]|uniref:Resuscitation-promoting factor rpfe n=1 Tax=Rhodococcus spongiicola TaxID=2487352 RepID=A0A3S3B0S9_9NOCA|nr:transglycosylase family protein [Rhodococcus spongiicola]RVW00452.1 resuscitation-promoting factor rpfe [Rhodococcus spongiicola]
MSNLTVKRVLGTAATTIALVAAPLAVAVAPANAASGNWDAVAQCESSGDWSINTGNGYYGGLQISEPTWHSFGGGPGLPHQYSKATQIQVAESILAGQGVGAWPVCGQYL